MVRHAVIAGFGFRQAAGPDSLADALDKVLARRQVAALATAWDRTDHPAIAILAARLGVPVIPIPAERLTAQQTPTQSARVRARYGCGSLAEASAMACGRLLGPRVVSGDGLASVALAESAGARPRTPGYFGQSEGDGVACPSEMSQERAAKGKP